MEDSSAETALVMSVVIRWHPRDGAVMEICFWYQRGWGGEGFDVDIFPSLPLLLAVLEREVEVERG